MEIPSLLILFCKGILIGFVIAAPVGPVGILCIRRTLLKQKFLAVVTGLGSAFADAFYATVAAFSLAGIATFLAQHDFYIKLFGGLLVAWMGVAVIRTPLMKNEPSSTGSDFFLHAFTSAFVLTLSNPITLIVFAAAFTAMGISPLYQSFSHALTLVSGVLIGACCWWITLMTVIYFLKHKLSDPQLLWINRFSGVILIGFSLYILISLV